MRHPWRTCVKSVSQNTSLYHLFRTTCFSCNCGP